MILDELSGDAKIVAAVVCTVVLGGFVFFAVWGMRSEARRNRAPDDRL